MAAHARPKHRKQHTRAAIRTGCITGLTATAAVLATGPTAVAASTPVSQGEGRFLGGSALGVNLASIVDVDPAQATNTGAKTSVTDSNPLSVTALDAVTVDIGPVNLLGGNGILSLGAVNQFARARSDGSSVAASGAVTNSGAIAVGGSNGVPKADATLDLGDLLGGGQTGLVSDLQLKVGALSAKAVQAAGKNGAQSGSYRIAGLRLELTSPALADVLDTLRTTLAGLQSSLDGVDETLEGLLVVPVVDVTGIPTLTGLVDDLGTVQNTNGGIVVDLQDGSVVLDVAKILAAAGLNLNNLPANTNLLPYVVDALTDELPGLVTGALDDLADDLSDAVGDIQAEVLGVPVNAGVLSGVLDGVLTPITDAVDDAADGLDTGLDDDIADVLSDLLALRANVKLKSGGTFTERALQLRVLPGADPDAAAVNLASASVGPNAGPKALAPPVITKPVYDSTTTDTTPTIAGTGKPGLKVTVVQGSRRICTATVKADRSWTCVPTDDMALGRHTITATQASATQKSGPSDPDRFTIVGDDVTTDNLPETGAGHSLPTAATGLALLLAGTGLVAAPVAAVGRHRARRGRHARR